ncbi:ribonuclease H [Senna tora]|uniref:Ribonuclease H n=1 Tax=Senna tora TaxID=362788 RepID=A0A834X709_9FABA|nr:ribonuclease H [Senna tora]
MKRLVTNSYDDNHVYVGVVRMIKELANQSWEVRFSHAYIEANGVADWCGERAIREKKDWILVEETPMGVQNLLAADIYGGCVPRTSGKLATNDHRVGQVKVSGPSLSPFFATSILALKGACNSKFATASNTKPLCCFPPLLAIASGVE